jgi:hypothetical protein
MKTTIQAHNLSPRKVQASGRTYSANPAVEEVGPQFENPKTLKVKDCCTTCCVALTL